MQRPKQGIQIKGSKGNAPSFSKGKELFRAHSWQEWISQDCLPNTANTLANTHNNPV